jgi:methionyl-tRNA formyltransferase
MPDAASAGVSRDAISLQTNARFERRSAIFFGHAGASDESAAIEKLLRLNFDVVFSHQLSFDDQNAFDQEELSIHKADFLFSFGPLIVRKPLLDSIQIAAINFHPAPPRWPGRGSCSMAILHGDKEFGATAHVMYPQVDAGPILKVIRFPIFEYDDAISLRCKAFAHMPILVQLVLNDLSQNQWQLKPCNHQWERKAVKKKDSLEMLRIAREDNAEVISRKLKASVGIRELSGAAC